MPPPYPTPKHRNGPLPIKTIKSGRRQLGHLRRGRAPLRKAKEKTENPSRSQMIRIQSCVKNVDIVLAFPKWENVHGEKIALTTMSQSYHIRRTQQIPHQIALEVRQRAIVAEAQHQHVVTVPEVHPLEEKRKYVNFI